MIDSMNIICASCGEEFTLNLQCAEDADSACPFCECDSGATGQVEEYLIDRAAMHADFLHDQRKEGLLSK
jgi:hypothetical protein